MSRATVLHVRPGKCPVVIEELRNSWGFAALVWDTIAPGCSWDRRLWDKALDLSIPQHQRTVLAMTFDNAIVRKKDFERAADDIGRWLVDFPPCGTFVNHLPRIMEIFEEQRDKDCEAIGIWCTSVTVNTYLDLGASDDESEVCLGEGDLLDVYVELDKMRDGGVVEGGTHCGS